MSDEIGKNKKKREQKKTERLKRLLGVDLCACGCGDKLKCHGVCRKVHTNPNSGRVECGECYQVDRSEVKSGGPKRPRRTWKFGQQKEGKENQATKESRREKRQRDRSE